MAELKTVIDGKVAVDGFPDGATVLVMSPNEAKPYVLSDEQERRIQQSMDSFARGEGIDLLEVLDGLEG